MLNMSSATRWLGALVLCVSSAAQAAYTVYIYEDGTDVVATGSGSLNVDALTLNRPDDGRSLIDSGQGNLVLGPTVLIGDVYDYGGSIAGPVLGSGAETNASDGSGQAVGLGKAVNTVVVPIGYVSGTNLGVSTGRWNAASLASLGLTAGVYTYTWGAGGTAESFTIRVGERPPALASATAIPTLSQWSALALAGTLAGLGLASLRRRIHKA